MIFSIRCSRCAALFFSAKADNPTRTHFVRENGAVAVVVTIAHILRLRMRRTSGALAAAPTMIIIIMIIIMTIIMIIIMIIILIIIMIITMITVMIIS